MHKPLTLDEIIGQKSAGLFLKIPDYQRGYSWQKPQRDDLLSDIEDLACHGSLHYTGTIVASPREDEDGTYLDVIDGQQRLTSLLLLIARTLIKLDEKISDDKGKAWIKELRDKYIVHERALGDSVQRLRLQDDINHRFYDLITTAALQTAHLPTQNKADDNLIEAAKHFDDWLNDHSVTLGLEKILDLVTLRLGFIFYKPNEDLEAGLMFEVINSRGKPLSELEKVKNYLIYFASRHGMRDLHRAVNRAWTTILRALSVVGMTSNPEERAFLRACWTVFGDPSPRPGKTVYEALRQKVEQTVTGEKQYQLLSRFIELLEHAATTYECMFTTKRGRESDSDLLALHEISFHPRMAAVIPIIIALFFKAGDNANRATRARILTLLEKLNFRYYVLGIAPRSDSNYGRLFSIAYNYFKDCYNNHDLASDTYLENQLIAFMKDETATARVVKNLVLEPDESWDFYQWNGLKYFLASYEQQLRSELKESSSMQALLSRRNPKTYNDFHHREHIFASNYKDDIHTAWADFLHRRLGNFVLTREGRNIFVSDHTVADKIKNRYWQRPNTTLYQLNELQGLWCEAYDFVFKKLGWTNDCKGARTNCIQRLGDIREKRLVEFALCRWGVPEVDGDAPNKVTIYSDYDARSGFGATWEWESGPAFDEQRKRAQATS